MLAGAGKCGFMSAVGGILTVRCESSTVDGPMGRVDSVFFSLDSLDSLDSLELAVDTGDFVPAGNRH